MRLAKDFPTNSIISQKRISVLRPFIELYLEYLEEMYPKDLEISVSLSNKAVSFFFFFFFLSELK